MKKMETGKVKKPKPGGLSFTDFDEEESAKGTPRFTKVTDAKGKKVARKEKEEEEREEPTPSKKKAKAKTKKKVAPVKTPKPVSSVPTPGSYRNPNAAHRHGWDWDENKVGLRAHCRRKGCQAVMFYAPGKRSGIERYYTIGSDKTRRKTIGSCPSTVEKAK